MEAIEFIKMSMETSKNMVMGMITDMKDAPLTQPTPKGGNHPLWVLGHLTYSEASLLDDVMLGETNPLAVTDANHYPAFDELATKFEEVRARTLTVLNGLTAADLDKPCKGCPPGSEDFLGTVGRCFSLIALHPAMHGGQVADARRAAGRKPVMG